MSRSDERNLVFWAGVVLALTGFIWIAVGRWEIAVGMLAAGGILLVLARYELN